MINITILDSILCKTDQPKMIRPFLQYSKSYWNKSAFSTEQYTYQSNMVKRDGTFLAGFLPRICKNLDERQIPYKIHGQMERLKTVKAEIQGYTPKPTQINLIEAACVSQRGIIVSPTGTGKTVIMGFIAAHFKQHKGLFLCHTISLVTQSYNEFTKMGLKVSLVYGKSKDLSGDIVVSSIQTFSKYDIAKVCGLFDYVLVDECHHVSSFTGAYHKVLTSLLATMKIGLTATVLPPGTESAMAMEGLLGPIIGEFTMEEALEAGVIAQPRVQLISIPKNANLQELRRYHEIYDVGVVNNRMRNKSLARFLLKMKSEGKTALVYIKKIEHIRKICEVLDPSLKYEIVEGKVSNEQREKYKAQLNNRDLDFIIASDAWKEGINIPGIDYVANAGGGKSEIAVLQIPGRGLRLAPGKTEVVIVDFIDCARYLSEHFAERMNLYTQKGWI